jgi:hypothetical protein
MPLRRAKLLIARLAALAGLALAFEQAAWAQRAARPERTQAQVDEARAAIQRRVDGGADPAADAAEAAGRGEFRLIVAGRFGATPPGVVCFTPFRAAPDFLALFRHGDVYDEPLNRFFGYTTAYNLALVNRPDYPDADLCRPAVQADYMARPSPRDLAVPARAVGRPPWTLHEAARRGGAADVRRLLRLSEVDALDPFGLTPLAWAVARNNREAVETLLEQGANPWLAGSEADWQSAVYWSAALGRRVLFQRLARLPGRPFERWPPMYLDGALAGGERAIVARILAEPHDPLRVDMLDQPLPSAALLEPALRKAPRLAGEMLFEALSLEGRPDLVRLALAYGADPNGRPPWHWHDTPLGMVAHGIHPSSTEIVDLLLGAGADPNLTSHRMRPLWRAFGSLTQDREDNEFDRRALAIADRLIAAGADINLPNWQGRPPVWVLFFPFEHSRREIDAGFLTPAVLDRLAERGLDLNAVWEGQRVLTEVEARAGPVSELAVALRRLGARH